MVHLQSTKEGDENYNFKDEEFKINEDGVFLLRNNFPYQQIKFNEIKKFEIRKLPYLNNSLILLVRGCGMILLSTYLFLVSIQNLHSVSNLFGYGGGKFSKLILILFLFAFGVYVLVNALKKGYCLVLKTSNKNIKLPLKEIEKKDN